MTTAHIKLVVQKGPVGRTKVRGTQEALNNILLLELLELQQDLPGPVQAVKGVPSTVSQVQELR